MRLKSSIFVVVMKNIWKPSNKAITFGLLALLSFHNLWALENKQDLSVKEAWEYILTHNHAIESSKLELDRNQKLSSAAKLSFLPSIDITATYIHLSDPIGVSNTGLKNSLTSLGSSMPAISTMLGPLLSQIPNQINIVNQDIIVGALNIIYPLYTGGKRIYGIHISKLKMLDSSELLRLKILSTFQEFIQVYYSIWLNQEILSTMLSMHKSAQSHYNHAIKLYKTGQIAKLEVIAAEVALEKTKNSIQEAKNALEISQMALDTILNAKNIHPTSIIHIPTSQALENEDYFVTRALDTYPALRSLDHKIQIAKEVKKIKIADFLPTVTLAGSYFIDNNFLFNNPSLPSMNSSQSLPNWYVGAIARLPLVTPTGRIPQLQASRIAEFELEHTKSQARQDMEVLVRRVYKETQYTQSQFQSMKKSVELAEENLKLQEKAFQQGLSTSLQVNDARNALQGVLLEQKMLAYKYVVLLAKLMAVGDNIDEFYELQR